MTHLSLLACIGILVSQTAAIVLRTASPPNTTNLALSRDVVREVNSKCRQICGTHDADSKCITSCEADLYRCHNHNITVPEGKKNYEKCESRVLNKYKSALAHLVGSKSRNLTHLSKAEQDKCKEVCNADWATESKCVTSCEAALYRCHNYNITVPKEKKFYDDCEKHVLHEHETSADTQLVARKALSISSNLTAILHRKCKLACSEDYEMESKCVTGCEADLYRCQNYNVTVPEGKKLFSECEERVLQEYKRHSAANFVAQSRGFDASALQHIEDSCHSVCGHNPSSSCLTGCEVEMYQCRDHNSTQPEGKKARDACEERALEKWRVFAQGMDFARHHVMPNATGTASFRHLRKSCLGVCAANVSQGCQTGCEVELYQCMDRRVSSPVCEEKVLDKYCAIGAFYAGDPPSHYGVRLEQLKQACQHSCGGKMDSSCQTRCEVDMYHCMDHNYTVPEGKHEYDHCVDDTLEKYRQESDVQTHLLSKTGAASQMGFDAVACDGVCVKDKSCAQSCRADMYHCGTTAFVMQRHQAGKSQDACKTRTAAKYKKLASKSGAPEGADAKPSKMK